MASPSSSGSQPLAKVHVEVQSPNQGAESGVQMHPRVLRMLAQLGYTKDDPMTPALESLANMKIWRQFVQLELPEMKDTFETEFKVLENLVANEQTLIKDLREKKEQYEHRMSENLGPEKKSINDQIRDANALQATTNSYVRNLRIGHHEFRRALRAIGCPDASQELLIDNPDEEEKLETDPETLSNHFKELTLCVTSMATSLTQERTELANQVGTLQSQINELNNRVNALQTAKDTLQISKNEFEDRVKTLQAEKDGLADQAGTLQNGKDELNNRVNTLQDEKDVLNNRLRTLQNEKDELANQAGTLQSGKDELNNRVNAVQDEKAELKDRVKTLEDEKDVFANEIRTLQSGKAELDGRLKKQAQTQLEITTKLQNELNDFKSKNDALKGAKKRLEASEKSLNQQLRTSAGQVETLTSQNSRLQAKLQGLANLPGEKAQLEQDLKTSQKERKTLQEQLAMEATARGQQEEEHAKFEKDVQEWANSDQAEMESAITKIRELRVQCSNFVSGHYSAHQQAGDRGRNQAQIDATNANETRDLQTEIRRMSHTFRSLCGLQDGYIANKDQQLQVLQASVNRQPNIIKVYEQQQEQARKELQNLQGELEASEKRIRETYQPIVQSLRTDNEGLQSRLNLVNSSKNEVKKSFNASQASLKAVELSKGNLKKALDTSQTTLAAAETNKIEIGTKLRNSETSLRETQEQLGHSQERLTKVQNGAVEANAERDRVKSMLTAVQNERDQVAERESRIASELQEANKQLQQKTTSANELQSSVEQIARLHNAELEKKDFALQELQGLLDQARRERDELKHAQPTREQPDARARETVSNQEPPPALENAIADRSSRLTGQNEADTRSSESNAGNGMPTDGTPSLRDQATPTSQSGGGQGKRKPDTALANSGGKRARQHADSGTPAPPGSIVFNVEAFMTGTLQLPVPQPIAEKLREQITKWRRNPGVWNRYIKAHKNPACIESRFSNKKIMWSHGIEKACDHCFSGRRLCVTWVSEEELRLLPAAGPAQGEGDGTRWIK
ncbi:MAG: hypothetical protein OHK93_006454 [Ramalina farinacea]|uniref:Uncharacterized protein n=1 Tax=Ramalina farinacea TaxID=258253 RepID=A0AA43TQ41_9LECA|nr:hypothetical protein [Ramalina farinacea]